VASTAAVLSQAQVLLSPLSLVPLFIGPPLGILTHVYSLHTLTVHAREHRGSSWRAFTGLTSRQPGATGASPSTTHV